MHIYRNFHFCKQLKMDIPDVSVCCWRRMLVCYTLTQLVKIASFLLSRTSTSMYGFACSGNYNRLWKDCVIFIISTCYVWSESFIYDLGACKSWCSVIVSQYSTHACCIHYILGSILHRLSNLVIWLKAESTNFYNLNHEDGIKSCTPPISIMHTNFLDHAWFCLI